MEQLFMTLVAEDPSDALLIPRTRFKNAFCLSSPAISRSTEKTFSDKVMLCGMRPAFGGWSRIGTCLPMESTITEGTTFRFELSFHQSLSDFKQLTAMIIDPLS
jgi:hypothetical protein